MFREGEQTIPATLVAPAGALVAAAIALTALSRVPLGPRGHDGDVVMVPLTALGLLLAATALLLGRPSAGRGRRYVRMACAAATTVLGIAVMGHYLVQWTVNPSDGGLLAGGHWWTQPPSAVTGLGLGFLGSSILAVRSARQDIRRWANVGAAATLVIALVSVVGHAYGAHALYGLNPWGGTAISTALALAALALGVLFVDSSRGVASIFGSRSTGGHLLRWLLPAAILAPLLLGWLALNAQNAGLVGPAFGTALLDVSLIVLLVGLVVRQAKVLHRIDAERERLLASERAARERDSSILESITDAFFAIDRDWRFTYLNREAERLLRRSREELLGRNVWSEFPEAGETFRREYHRAMSEQRTVHFEAYYEPFGTWFEVRAFPGPEGLSVYFQNVTERKLADERLRESEERYRLLADMIPQHIWTTEANGYHTYFSRRWYEFTGATHAQTQGEGWLHLLHPEDRERTLARWAHSLRTGEPYVVEYRFRNTEGKYRWFLGQAMPLRNPQGEIIRWFGTLTDISEQKQHADERERLLQMERAARAEADCRRVQLEQVTESRNKLMRGFSHDVRNPLGVADAQAWLLEDGRMLGELSEKQRDSVRRIRRAIRGSLKLIEDLLELTRAEAGQIDLERVKTDVGAIAREAAEDFRAAAAAAGHAIEVEAAPGLETRTDATRVGQILANLLSNAVKYAGKGVITVKADIAQTGGPGPGPWIAVRVIDTGPGIPREKQESIFEEYTRLDTSQQPGAGIGLAISRRIARLLEGDLTVGSDPGSGSTFTLWLPMRESPTAYSSPGSSSRSLR